MNYHISIHLENWLVVWNIVSIFHILGTIIPFDYVFFRGVETTNQKDRWTNMVKPWRRCARWSVWEQIMPTSESKGIYADATQKVRGKRFEFSSIWMPEMGENVTNYGGLNHETWWSTIEKWWLGDEKMVIQLFKHQTLVIQQSETWCQDQPKGNQASNTDE